MARGESSWSGGVVDVPRILCQPGGGKSCGACCGMYNHREADEGELRARLEARTRAFHARCDVRDPETLKAFRLEWEDAPEDKLLGELPSCPFLGMLDDGGTDRVGCMVHPFQNDGVDGRDCGVYDRHTCEDYLCAAHSVMTRDEKWLVLAGTRDSYVYGLVVTDVRFVRELFALAARINGAMPTGKALGREGVLEAARAYFELKRDWPWRAPDGVFGQVIPGEGLDTPRRPGPSEQAGVEADVYESALRCLGTQVEHVGELEAAREVVAERVAAFAKAVAS